MIYVNEYTKTVDGDDIADVEHWAAVTLSNFVLCAFFCLVLVAKNRLIQFFFHDENNNNSNNNHDDDFFLFIRQLLLVVVVLFKVRITRHMNNI